MSGHMFTPRRWHGVSCMMLCVGQCALAQKVRLLQDNTSPGLAPTDFPADYSLSVRGLSDAIVAARPANIKDYFKDVDVEMDEDRRFVRVNSSSLGVDYTGLREEISRLEKHFNNIKTLLPSGLHIEDASTAHLYKLTDFSDYYNVFYLNNSAVGHLYWVIKAVFHKYAALYKLDLNRVFFIHSWFNCFRPSVQIDKHNHGMQVSGNIPIFIPEGSFTHYYSLTPADRKAYNKLRKKCIASEFKDHGCTELDVVFGDELPKKASGPKDKKVYNNIGDVVMFYGETEHESSRVTEEMGASLEQQEGPVVCRMTEAYDLITHPSFGFHSVPLYDPEDPWWEKDPRGSIGDFIGRDLKARLEKGKVPKLFEWDKTPTMKDAKKRMKIIDGHSGLNEVTEMDQVGERTNWADIRKQMKAEQDNSASKKEL